MKRIFLICAIGNLFYSAFCQTDTILITKTDTSFYSDLENKFGNDSDITVETNPEPNVNNQADQDLVKEHVRSHGYFKGHWAGIEFGITSYLNSNKGLTLLSNDQFMSLNTNKSINVNVNLFNLSYPLISDRLGFVSGIGIEWYNYSFQHQTSIQVDSLGNTVERTYPNPNNVSQSSLTTVFISVPLIMEFNFRGGYWNHRFHLSAGIVGSVMVSSHTSVIYAGQTERDWSNFTLNYLRYGFTARVGYHQISIFGTYYPVSLFETGKGPELYPFSLGLAWNLFN